MLSVVVCDICLTLNASSALSSITAMWYGIFMSSRSSELLAKVDMLLFRDNPNQCIGLFDTDEIATAVKCIALSDVHVCLSVCYFSYFHVVGYFVSDFNNRISW